MIEHSTRDSRAVKGVLLAAIILLAMICFTIYRILDIGFFARLRLEIYAELVLTGLLILRCYPKYTYSLSSKYILVTKKGLFGSTTHKVFYNEVFGLTRYKAQLGGSFIKFRRTFRVNSALDGRDIWVLAYTFPKKKGSENRRMYMKMSEEFLLALNKKLPNSAKAIV